MVILHRRDGAPPRPPPRPPKPLPPRPLMPSLPARTADAGLPARPMSAAAAYMHMPSTRPDADVTGSESWTVTGLADDGDGADATEPRVVDLAFAPRAANLTDPSGGVEIRITPSTPPPGLPPPPAGLPPPPAGLPPPPSNVGSRPLSAPHSASPPRSPPKSPIGSRPLSGGNGRPSTGGTHPSSAAAESDAYVPSNSASYPDQGSHTAVPDGCPRHPPIPTTPH